SKQRTFARSRSGRKQIARQRSFRLRNLRRCGVDFQPWSGADTHHFISPGRRASHSKYRLTLLQKSNRNGMEDLVEGFVADLPGPGHLKQTRRHALTPTSIV